MICNLFAFETLNNQLLSSLLQHVCTFKGKLITNQADQRDLSTIKRETDKNLHQQSPATQTSVPPGISLKEVDSGKKSHQYLHHYDDDHNPDLRHHHHHHHHHQDHLEELGGWQASRSVHLQ